MENYRRFVSEGGGAAAPWDGLVGGAVLIAIAAGLHYSSVSKIIKGWENSQFKA